jgi:hypothetical protein
VIETIRQGLKDDGFAVSISKLCRWFKVPRRTVYYSLVTRKLALTAMNSPILSLPSIAA